jgi:hypothetical protein
LKGGRKKRKKTNNGKNAEEIGNKGRKENIIEGRLKGR